VTTGVLLFMLATLGWIVWSRPPPLPTLAFIGYTNKPLTIVAAQVLLKNPSHVPLEILPQIQAINVVETNGEFFNAPGFHSPWPGDLPRVVAPAATTLLDVHLNYDFREPWWIEVCTRPRPHPSKLRDWAARIKQPTLRKYLQRIFPPVTTSYTKLGPFTNLPPGWIRVYDGTARRR
jgi:hypothetical protein